jgi:hypothetical protein
MDAHRILSVAKTALPCGRVADRNAWVLDETTGWNSCHSGGLCRCFYFRP